MWSFDPLCLYLGLLCDGFLCLIVLPLALVVVEAGEVEVTGIVVDVRAFAVVGSILTFGGLLTSSTGGVNSKLVVLSSFLATLFSVGNSNS